MHAIGHFIYLLLYFKNSLELKMFRLCILFISIDYHVYMVSCCDVSFKVWWRRSIELLNDFRRIQKFIEESFWQQLCGCTSAASAFLGNWLYKSEKYWGGKWTRFSVLKGSYVIMLLFWDILRGILDSEEPSSW